MDANEAKADGDNAVADVAIEADADRTDEADKANEADESKEANKAEADEADEADKADEADTNEAIDAEEAEAGKANVVNKTEANWNPLCKGFILSHFGRACCVGKHPESRTNFMMNVIL